MTLERRHPDTADPQAGDTLSAEKPGQIMLAFFCNRDISIGDALVNNSYIFVKGRFPK